MISTAQRYVIFGLLALILANIGYSGWLYVKNLRTEAARSEAVRDLESTRASLTNAESQIESANKSLELAQKELNAIRQAIATREDRIEQIKREKEASDEKLQDALERNRDWGSTPVPDSVRDALE